jgi:hypothetical protein
MGGGAYRLRRPFYWKKGTFYFYLAAGLNLSDTQAHGENGQSKCG